MNDDLVISIEDTSDQLMNGQVGVMPTDTVYGLVARAHDEQAVARLYALKNRERKPGTVIAANIEQLLDLGVSGDQLDKVKQWWPGPVSVVLSIDDKFTYLHQGLGNIAIRVVADEKVQNILQTTGPLLTSSANHPGKPGAVTVTEACNYFGDRVDFYVDGGDLSGRDPSTIVRLTEDGNVELIRDGALAINT